MVLTSECLWSVDSSFYKTALPPRAMGQKLYPDLLPELNLNWAPTRIVNLPRNTGPRPSEPGSAVGLSLEGRLNKQETGSP